MYKHDRSDLSHPSDYYQQEGMKRTLSQIKEHVKRKTFGCQHEPLLDTEPENIFPCELHILLRIVDKLIAILMDICIKKDKGVSFTTGKRTFQNVKTFEKIVSFRLILLNIFLLKYIVYDFCNRTSVLNTAISDQRRE